MLILGGYSGGHGGGYSSYSQRKTILFPVNANSNNNSIHFKSISMRRPHCTWVEHIKQSILWNRKNERKWKKCHVFVGAQFGSYPFCIFSFFRLHALRTNSIGHIESYTLVLLICVVAAINHQVYERQLGFRRPIEIILFIFSRSVHVGISFVYTNEWHLWSIAKHWRCNCSWFGSFGCDLKKCLYICVSDK